MVSPSISGKINFLYYQPKPIRIPEGIRIRRKLSRRNTKLSEIERSTLFDLRTVFYDVFFLPQENRILAIGPAWMNLNRHLLPLQLYLDNKKVEFQLTHIKKICLLMVETPGDNINSTIELRFQFPKFTSRIQLNTSEPADNPRSGRNERLTICTLQKDNPEQWIEDWIYWYKRLYGIGRFLLYDNGSSNRESLIERIKTLDADVTVILLDWPFEYGIKPDKLAQRGAFNHCRLHFPVANGYCINTDIDEYLVNETGQELLQYLDSVFESSNVGSVRMREHWIPLQQSRSRASSSPMRAFHYGFYRRDHGISPWGKTKYIYRYDRIIYNSVHVAVAGANKLENQIFPWRKYVNYAVSNFRQLIGWLIGLPRKPKKLLCIYYAPPSQLFYFHFRGLRLRPTKADKHGVEKFDASVHIEEPRIQQLCRKAGIMPHESVDNQ